MRTELIREDPQEAWRYVRRHEADIRCAVAQGRLAWGMYGPEAECPYPDGDARKRAWGRGYNAARRNLSLDESRIVADFRANRELA